MHVCVCACACVRVRACVRTCVCVCVCVVSAAPFTTRTLWFRFWGFGSQIIYVIPIAELVLIHILLLPGTDTDSKLTDVDLFNKYYTTYTMLMSLRC